MHTAIVLTAGCPRIYMTVYTPSTLLPRILRCDCHAVCPVDYVCLCSNQLNVGPSHPPLHLTTYSIPLLDNMRQPHALRMLPVSLLACKLMLVLFGQTYQNRLWCAWETFARTDECQLSRRGLSISCFSFRLIQIACGAPGGSSFEQTNAS